MRIHLLLALLLGARGGPDTSDQLDPDFSVQIIQATVGAAAERLDAP